MKKNTYQKEKIISQYKKRKYLINKDKRYSFYNRG